MSWLTGGTGGLSVHAVLIEACRPGFFNTEHQSKAIVKDRFKLKYT